jgi:hypothetical protein
MRPRGDGATLADRYHLMLAAGHGYGRDRAVPNG